jgi:hypothetical protein
MCFLPVAALKNACAQRLAFLSLSAFVLSRTGSDIVWHVLHIASFSSHCWVWFHQRSPLTLWQGPMDLDSQCSYAFSLVLMIPCTFLHLMWI